MKKLIFCLFIVTVTLNSYSQSRENFSTEIDVNYYNYLSIGQSTNNFNYGFSLLFSKHIKKLKISTGINYSTKSYFYEVTPIVADNYLSKKEYNISYLNFPIIANVEVFSKKSFQYSLLMGASFNHVINYNIDSYYLYNPRIRENISVKKIGLGTTLTFGASISKLISSKFRVNFAPFLNFKIKDNESSYYSNIDDDNLSVGAKISFEYLF